MWCSAFESGRIDDDDTRIRQDRSRMLTDIARELDISLESAHRTVNEQLHNRKLFARRAQKSLTHTRMEHS
jgi:hypothetical protein